MHRGYIKIWRRTMDSFTFIDSETFHLWVTLLLLAGYEEKEIFFNGKKIMLKRGQFISGRKSLSDRTGISESKVYRLLYIFEREQLIEQQKSNLCSIISICNYNEYQSNEQQNEHLINNQRTTSEQPVNTTNTLKRNNKKDVLVFTPPSLDEIKAYCLERKNKVDPERFLDAGLKNGWVDKNGNKYKDWKAVIRTWERWDKVNGSAKDILNDPRKRML